MSLAAAMLTFGNWRARFIAPQPRAVHVSAELAFSLAKQQHHAAISSIIEKLETGLDVNAHLSKGVSVAYQPQADRAAALHRRRDLDQLISDWGMHHLHLSTDVGPDGFVARTGDLLFVAIKPDAAYLLDVLPHGNWAEVGLVEIAVRNWPNAGIVHRLQGVLGLAQPTTADDRHRLRRAGVVCLLEIDGMVFTPPGQTTAGTPMRVTIAANKCMNALRQLRQGLDENPDALDDLLQAKGIDAPRPGAWSPHVDDETGLFGMVEATTGTFVPVGQIPDW